MLCMFPFRKLAVWRRAHALALMVHEVTERNFRGRYASLIDQMRQASSSVPSNIAEGSGATTAPQFARYLAIAICSARELDYHVLLAKDLGVLPLSDYARLSARTDQLCGMLAVLRVRVLERAETASRNRLHQARAVNPKSALRHPPSG